jgi:hypothetical protein
MVTARVGLAKWMQKPAGGMSASPVRLPAATGMGTGYQDMRILAKGSSMPEDKLEA